MHFAALFLCLALSNCFLFTNFTAPSSIQIESVHSFCPTHLALLRRFPLDKYIRLLPRTIVCEVVAAALGTKWCQNVVT